METWYVCQIDDGGLGVLATASTQASAERKLRRLMSRAEHALFVTCDLAFWEGEVQRRAEANEVEDWWASYAQVYPDHDGAQ